MWGKNILARRNSKCEVPEADMVYEVKIGVKGFMGFGLNNVNFRLPSF